MAHQAKVVLLGCGLVGKAVLKQLKSSSNFLKTRFNVNVSIVAIGDSTGLIRLNQESKESEIDQIIAYKDSKKVFKEHANFYASLEQTDLIQQCRNFP
jgi:homoserine dehydrogenase